MPREHDGMAIGDLISPTLATRHPDPAGELARWFRRVGVNLLRVADSDLSPGTPVFIEANCDEDEVRRRMIAAHAYMLPVLRGDELLGIVDVVELVGRARETRSAWGPEQRLPEEMWVVTTP